jgi:hypothetical protein
MNIDRENDVSTGSLGFQMQDVLGYSDLCRYIERLSRPVSVAIDGFMQSGKSPLARTLASKFNGFAIHTDEFVTGSDESRPYFERIDCGKIRETVVVALSNSRLVTIEGICLRQLLAHVAVEPNVFVYIKRVDSSGTWHDGFHLEDYENDPEFMEYSPTRRSQLEYHRMHRPHERADFVLLRPDTKDEA